MMSNLPEARPLGGDTDTAERDDWLHFPIAWAETGQYGMLMVSPKAWRGLAYRYQAAGAPQGTPSTCTWWYSWDGRCFVPYSRIDPPKLRHPGALGSLGWTLLWAFFLGVPTLILSGVLVGAVPPPPNGTTHAQDHVAVAITLAFWIAVWFSIHQFRVARRR